MQFGQAARERVWKVVQSNCPVGYQTLAGGSTGLVRAECPVETEVHVLSVNVMNTEGDRGVIRISPDRTWAGHGPTSDRSSTDPNGGTEKNTPGMCQTL